MFFSSCNSVKFHGELLNYVDVPVKAIHGKQKQAKRTTTFFEFCQVREPVTMKPFRQQAERWLCGGLQADSGILLCTDVAARGLDIPAVDWIIQVGHGVWTVLLGTC